MSRPARRLALGPEFAGVLSAARTGAPWAMRRLYDALAPAVAGYLRVQGSTDPEDLTSEVLYHALTGLDRFSGDEAGFRSWVFTIAHNRLVDERRRLARRPRLAGPGLDPAPAAPTDVESEVLGRLGTERVRSLCEGLAPDQREVLLLRMAGGMSLEETAAALGKSTGAVKALQHRAVAALRRQFQKDGVSR